MNIHWENYVWEGPHPVDPGELEELEAAWGVELPTEYKHIAPQCHGMAPSPGVFVIGGGSANVFNNLLTLTSGEHEKGYAISTKYRNINPYVPSGVFPFGMTPGGEHICFDYRDAPAGQPRIVLVTVEMEIYFISNSFREFLEALRD